MTHRGGRPRDRALDDALLGATLELLAERGYAATTLTAVAARAGTTTPSIYRRWPSKADLVLDAVFRLDRSEIVAATGDLERDISLMVRWALEKFGQPAGRAAFAGLVAESPTGPVPRLERMAGMWQQVSDRLTDAISSGELRPDLDVGQLLSVLVGPALMAVVLEGEAAVSDRNVELFTQLVLRGVAAAPPPTTTRTTEKDRR
ncbi:MAG: TetR/AcrR family transcriptional regulator [Acidimicrobiales bacterium]|nr:TetR/AcrR family transcriptional regulator [Acidimicrobiales bacterium]